jgi:hypothetical protein
MTIRFENPAAEALVSHPVHSKSGALSRPVALGINPMPASGGQCLKDFECSGRIIVSQ